MFIYSHYSIPCADDLCLLIADFDIGVNLCHLIFLLFHVKHKFDVTISLIPVIVTGSKYL